MMITILIGITADSEELIIITVLVTSIIMTHGIPGAAITDTATIIVGTIMDTMIHGTDQITTTIIRASTVRLPGEMDTVILPLTRSITITTTARGKVAPARRPDKISDRA